MKLPSHVPLFSSRRQFLREAGLGFGALALAAMSERETQAAAHFAPKADRVLFLFMEGGPSHVDLFDPKPGLQKWHGQSLPESMTKDLQLAFIKPTAKVLASPRVFTPHGQSGMELSD